MDKQILIEILCDKIDDEQFIDIIFKVLNIETLNSFKSNIKKDISQNPILSELLCNIYLNKLDIRVQELRKQKEININKNSKINNYSTQTNQLRIKEFKNLSKKKQTRLINQKKKLAL
jgi:hypothetical protein